MWYEPYYWIYRFNIWTCPKSVEMSLVSFLRRIACVCEIPLFSKDNETTRVIILFVGKLCYSFSVLLKWFQNTGSNHRTTYDTSWVLSLEIPSNSFGSGFWERGVNDVVLVVNHSFNREKFLVLPKEYFVCGPLHFLHFFSFPYQNILVWKHFRAAIVVEDCIALTLIILLNDISQISNAFAIIHKHLRGFLFTHFLTSVTILSQVKDFFLELRMVSFLLLLKLSPDIKNNFSVNILLFYLLTNLHITHFNVAI